MGVFASLLPTENERQLQINLIDEAMRLYGIEAVLIDVNSVSMYADNHKLSGREYHIHVLLDSHPNRRLLANLRFNHLEKTDSPIIMYIPFQFGGRKLNIVKDQILCIGDEDWRITAVNSTYLTGLWYVCTVVPFIKEEERPRDRVKHQSQFFNPGEVEFT